MQEGKKAARLKSFKLSQDVTWSISLDMKKFHRIVTAVRLQLEAVEKTYLFLKMARLLRPEISQTNLWQKKMKKNCNKTLW